MPHAVISGPLDLEAWARAFRPETLARGRDVLRTVCVLVDSGGRAALVEAVAIEAGRKLPFYVKVSVHERGTFTVRVDPLTHVERSAGVKELVAHVARSLLAFAPGAEVARTNLVLFSGEANDSSDAGSSP